MSRPSSHAEDGPYRPLERSFEYAVPKVEGERLRRIQEAILRKHGGLASSSVHRSGSLVVTAYGAGSRLHPGTFSISDKLGGDPMHSMPFASNEEDQTLASYSPSQLEEARSRLAELNQKKEELLSKLRDVLTSEERLQRLLMQQQQLR